MSGAARVRPFRPGDAGAVARIERAVSGAARWADGIATATDGREAAVAAGADDDLVGYAVWRTAAGEAELLSIAVDPAARRRGLGGALLAAAVAAARARGAQSMFLEVAEDNAAALALYSGAGFAQTGRRPGYYGPIAARVLARALQEDDTARLPMTAGV